jgi:hypothetical protein
MVRWLCQIGVDPDACSSVGETPVLEAVKRGDLEIVRYLLGFDAKV